MLTALETSYSLPVIYKASVCCQGFFHFFGRVHRDKSGFRQAQEIGAYIQNSLKNVGAKRSVGRYSPLKPNRKILPK